MLIVVSHFVTQNADGQCLPCQCHGRADSCDIITGICVNCTNDTAGKECDICAPTFFGDAASYSCRRMCDYLNAVLLELSVCDPLQCYFTHRKM